MEIELAKVDVLNFRKFAKKLDLSTFCRLYRTNRTMKKRCESAESFVTFHVKTVCCKNNQWRAVDKEGGDITNHVDQSKFQLHVECLILANPETNRPIPPLDDQMEFIMNSLSGKQVRIDRIWGVNCNASLLTDFIQKFHVTMLTKGEIVVNKRLEDVLLSQVKRLDVQLSGVDPHSFLQRCRSLVRCDINFVNNPIGPDTVRMIIEMAVSNKLKLDRWVLSPLVGKLSDEFIKGFTGTSDKNVPLVKKYDESDDDLFKALSEAPAFYQFIVSGKKLTIQSYFNGEDGY